MKNKEDEVQNVIENLELIKELKKELHDAKLLYMGIYPKGYFEKIKNDNKYYYYFNRILDVIKDYGIYILVFIDFVILAGLIYFFIIFPQITIKTF